MMASSLFVPPFAGYYNEIPRLCLPTEGDRFRCECKVVSEAPPERRTIGGDIVEGLEDFGNDIIDFFSGRRLSHADMLGFTEQQMRTILAHPRGRMVFTRTLANATAAFHGEAFARQKLEQQARETMAQPRGRRLFFDALGSLFSGATEGVVSVNEDLANADPEVAAELVTSILSGGSNTAAGNENCLTNKENALKAAQCEDPEVAGGLQNLCFYARYARCYSRTLCN
jgi:hypothetical protein